MKAQSAGSAAGYVLIIIGIMLSLVSALLPHFHTGYRLDIGVFVAGIAPWLVYALIVPLRHNAFTVICGLVLLGAHAWLVTSERFSGEMPYVDNLIYQAPLAMAVLLIPLLIYTLSTTGYPQATRRGHDAEQSG